MQKRAILNSPLFFYLQVDRGGGRVVYSSFMYLVLVYNQLEKEVLIYVFPPQRK
jgi:hypothetical protein